ncbi:MAG: hypothetical protein AB7H66_06500 [Hyphomonadaceae bacterium]
MIRSLLFASCVGACMMVGSATWAQRAGSSVSGALTQPLRDLSILRPEPEQVLQRAAAAPYAIAATLPNGALDCKVVNGEIAWLDAALGDDLDAARGPEATLMAQARSGAGDALIDAVGDLVDLPYRGLIRRITGAERREREMQAAVQAGMVRRAFLRGLSARECATPRVLAVIEATPAVAVTAVEAEVPLSDLELAQRQLAAANAAAMAPAPPVVGETASEGAMLQVVAEAASPNAQH